MPPVGAATAASTDVNAQATATTDGPLPSTTAQPDGPLPPANAAPASVQPQAASAEPPNPSEYDVAADTDPGALTDFRATLDPYGDWVDDSTYGTVWVPASTVVGVGFTPYVTGGHWGLTADSSWIWVSDYNWGWAPFHYGRWVWIGGRGWAWIPGRVYSPAWVVWRTGYYDDYYIGWAPMPPLWYWHSGFAVSLWYVPPAPYVFCSSRYVFSPRVHGYIVPSGRVDLIAPRTRPYIAATAGVGASSYRLPSAARGPTMADGHVPASAVPAFRDSHDARAISFSRNIEGARPMQSRSFAGVGSERAPLSRMTPASTPRPISQGPTPVDRPSPAPLVGPRPFTPAPTPRPFTPTPAPVAPRPFTPTPAPVAPRPFTPTPAPVAPRSFSPSPAPVAPRSFSPAPVAPRSFSPAPVAPRSFSPAPVAPRSFSPAPVAPRSFSPAPAGRSFRR
jgi:hypothetical protein